ncbi:helix-turn-helix transcriptional regulator [Georgenia deserti]|uniref:Helix-turn-helix transcriptional regulator n=1 Tax=Georgenia deserti TaxID=2093781 RepID=A0ABW4L979_9MICO
MRADRMIAIVLVLQSRERVTAAELAAELEVSVATARRDLEALSTAGVPVYPRSGRGGGWQLVGGARTNLSGLTAPESRALFLALGSGAAAPEVRSALRKLLRAIPGPFQAEAQSALAAIRTDPAGWGENASAPPPHLADLERAVLARRRVTVDYTSRRGGPSAGPRRRTLSPLRLVDKAGTWYLLGLPDGREDVRTFRVDRISGVELLDEPARVPEDLEAHLEAAWRETVETSEGARSAVSATVAVESRHVPVVLGHFGRHGVEVGPEPGADPGAAPGAGDGRRQLVRITAHTERGLAEQLAGWGAAVEVLEPESVRAELAGIGAELMARYAGQR